MENLIVDNKLKTNREELYKNVIFQKNVHLSACDYFKNYQKIFILTSPTPRDKYLQFLVNVLNENKINYCISVLNKSTVCDNDIILKTCARAKDSDLIVAFGAGTVADIAKISANNLNLPFCVLPTTLTHYGILNNVAYLFDNGLPKIISTKFPDKVFIDVDIIKKSPERFILSSIYFSISLLENLFVLESQKRILGECNINLVLLNKKIQKIEELLNWVSLSKDFALLNLMDYIIDLNEICKNNYTTNSIFYSLTLNCSTLKNNFGEKCLLSSTILFNIYNSFFNQKYISVRALPDREKLLKQIPKYHTSFFENYIKKTDCLMTQNLNMVLNKQVTELTNILTLYKNSLSKFVKKVLLINNDNKIRMIDENEVFINLETLPFIYDNFLLNLITRYGYLNVS